MLCSNTEYANFENISFKFLKDKDTFYTFIVFKILQKLNFKFAYHANP